jgi:penicillin-insensitive murein endopeptidase
MFNPISISLFLRIPALTLPSLILNVKMIVANLPRRGKQFRGFHGLTKIAAKCAMKSKSLFTAAHATKDRELRFNLFRSTALALGLIMAGTSAFAGDPIPAKKLFGAVELPTRGNPQSLGFYAKGCLSGGEALPADGPTWQVLHPSRNRRWGNPRMLALIEKLSLEAHDYDGWNGLLVGDISQPRGGPMLSGHASHQIGLDADVWLTPMPNRTLSYEERERFPENSMLRKGSLYVDPNKWSKPAANLIMRAASYPQVERIFVHPGIKKKLCESWTGDRSLLSKVRPMYGHNYHFHIRIKCPAGSAGCDDQVDPPTDSGCGKPLAEWFAKLKPRPVSKPVKKPTKPVKPWYLTMNALPKACTTVLNGKAVPSMASAEYGVPAQATGDVAITETAFAAPVVTSDATVFRSIEDFSDLIPRGPVPVPLERP